MVCPPGAGGRTKQFGREGDIFWRDGGGGKTALTWRCWSPIMVLFLSFKMVLIDTIVLIRFIKAGQSSIFSGWAVSGGMLRKAVGCLYFPMTVRFCPSVDENNLVIKTSERSNPLSPSDINFPWDVVGPVRVSMPNWGSCPEEPDTQPRQPRPNPIGCLVGRPKSR